MLGYLGGNAETVSILKAAIGKVITSVWLDEGNNQLKFTFEDSTGMYLFDDGQSCCESKYMTTDDILSEYAGTTFLNVEIKDGGGAGDSEYGGHDIQFLEITTDKGVFQMSNHNKYNGYYGRFSIIAKPINP